MRKSSVYLPDELKQALSELAVRTGHSEADLIRQAIERLVSVADASAPTHPAPTVAVTRPALIGVGVGPGDPALVTEKARALLLAADHIIVASTDLHSTGRAEMVVSVVAPTATIARVAYAIGPDADGRRSSLRAVVDAVLACVDAGELAVIAVLGDPSQWTIFPELAAAVKAVRPGLAVSAVPGITSYQVIAAEASTALGQAGAPLVVTDDAEHLGLRLADSEGAVVLYKATTEAEMVKDAAERTQRTGLVGELVGLRGQRLRALADTPDGPISYLATVVFPATAATPVDASAS